MRCQINLWLCDELLTDDDFAEHTMLSYTRYQMGLSLVKPTYFEHSCMVFPNLVLGRVSIYSYPFSRDSRKGIT